MTKTICTPVSGVFIHFAEAEAYKQDRLTLCVPQQKDKDGVSPAQTIQLQGLEIKLLMAFLEEVYND
jgi:hypothetical protein